MRRLRTLLALSLIGLIPAVGLPAQPPPPCGSIEVDPQPNTPEFGSPDAVIAGLVKAYESRDVELYASLLHPDFEFHTAPENRRLAPPDGVWGRQREIEIATRMFSRAVGWTPNGRMIPPVTGIRLELTAAENWREHPDSPDHFTRAYDTHLVVEFEAGLPLVVRRVQEFTVTGRRSEHDMQLSEFQLVCWREAGRCRRPDHDLEELVR